MIDERRTLALNTDPVGTGPVLYVMGREQRVTDSWPLLYAAKMAADRQVPLVVLFAVGPAFLHASQRHVEWLIASLKEVSTGLQALSIPFLVRVGDWVDEVVGCANELAAGEVVFDMNPLEPIRSWREVAAAQLKVRATLVDGHNIIPVWVTSDKQEFAAHTIRPKVHKLLADFLVPFPDLTSYALPKNPFKTEAVDPDRIRHFRMVADGTSVPATFAPGEQAAQAQLTQFVAGRLNGYAEKRNDPNEDALSGLSPYLRWGNISAQRVALTVQQAKVARADKEAFLEELIVRRELSDNYVYYTKDYATVGAAHAWAQKTLADHARDPREYVYTLEQFEQAETHDPLWNAAQLQMVTEGKMHGYLRMYWAKKILEWTSDPQTAIDIALTLNDRYELDGRDSNGVVGVMWSICGVHDRAWTERPVFGKIRYMNYNGCKRKFDVDRFIARYEPTKALFQS